MHRTTFDSTSAIFFVSLIWRPSICHRWTRRTLTSRARQERGTTRSFHDCQLHKTTYSIKPMHPWNCYHIRPKSQFLFSGNISSQIFCWNFGRFSDCTSTKFSPKQFHLLFNWLMKTLASIYSTHCSIQNLKFFLAALRYVDCRNIHCVHRHWFLWFCKRFIYVPLALWSSKTSVTFGFICWPLPSCSFGTGVADLRAFFTEISSIQVV